MDKSKIQISGNQAIKFLGIISLIWLILTYASTLILPLLVSAIIATLLDKPTKIMKKWGFPSWLAISISIVVSVIIFVLLSWLISSQVNNIADDWPTIKEKAIQKFELFSGWMQNNFQVNPKKVFNKNVDFFSQLKVLAQGFLSSVSNVITNSFIILIYTILFLMQKHLFIRFFKKLVNNEAGASNILKESAQIISGYLFGKGKIMFLLFIIYFIGFKVAQVPYALFLALFASLFSIIPYR